LDKGRVRDTGRGGSGPGAGAPLGGLGGGRGGRGGNNAIWMLLPLFMRLGWKGKLVVGMLLVLVLTLGMCGGPNLLGGGTGGGILGGTPGYSPNRMADSQDSGRYDHCRTGDDANRDHDCARVAVENSMTTFWADELGSDFRPISALTTFTDGVQTACGAATSSIGPFYCPADDGIYLDTTFFEEVLARHLGGPRGGFVEIYVLAHEYGHHISNVLGFMSKVRRQDAGPQSDATRLELQADCFAGMWAHHATTTRDANGEVLIAELTEEDIRLALEAARTVGDDYIQQASGGQINPDSWTHGSSEQRMNWFMVGYQQGSLQACDTFSADQV
jgi:predicted metalloprotease